MKQPTSKYTSIFQVHIFVNKHNYELEEIGLIQSIVPIN